MKPTLGAPVIYCRQTNDRQPVEEFAARITRVIAKPLVAAAAVNADRLAVVAARSHEASNAWYLACKEQDALADGEGNYEVWLAVDIHTDQRGEVWFTKSAIPFHEHGAVAHTWRWP